jgi:NAD(P)-dependent dehydrogenase (short-subunit alcohol dehydrogenase family)
MLLAHKNAVIYGGGGTIGGAVARAFAQEGARVFITGRNAQSLEAVVNDITNAGGRAEWALVDALDPEAINAHMDTLIAKAGRIDISFNAIGVAQKGIQGTPLVALSPEHFSLPLMTLPRSYFMTATAAARKMEVQGGGVILALTATPARIASPMVGGMAPAWAAMEALSRSLSAELGPKGIRVIGLRSNAIPETKLIEEVFNMISKGAGMNTLDEFQAGLEQGTLLKRLPKLQEVINLAVFMASDQASAMTGAVVNLSCGSVVD